MIQMLTIKQHNQINNNFMSFLPIIKSRKHSSRFTNPLNGFIYNNSNFDKSFSERQGEQQSKVCFSYADIFGEGKSENGIFSQRKIKKKIGLDRKKGLNKTIDTSETKYHTIDTAHNKKFTLNELSTKSYKYPKITITPILPSSVNPEKPFIVTFEEYYKTYFKNHISSTNKQLITKIEKYRQTIIKDHQLINSVINQSLWPRDLFEVKNTDELLTKIQHYEKLGENQHYWVRFLLVMLRFYCFPNRKISEGCFENIKNELKQHLTINTSIEYQLFLPNGQQIIHFLHLPFPTTNLYILQKQSLPLMQQKIVNYKKQIACQQTKIKNDSLPVNLKLSFRKNITKNNYDELGFNYDACLQKKKIARNRTIQVLGEILGRKNSKQGFAQQRKEKIDYNRIDKISQDMNRSRESKMSRNSSQLTKQSSHPIPFFHLSLPTDLKAQIHSTFITYQNLTKAYIQRYDPTKIINQDSIFINILKTQNEILSQYMKEDQIIKHFFEALLREKLQWNIGTIEIGWKEFVEFWIICCGKVDDVYEIEQARNVVEGFVHTYFHIENQQTTKNQLQQIVLISLNNNSQTCQVFMQILWSWLSQNNLLYNEYFQLYLLQKYPLKRKRFYMLMVSLITCTFKTSPIDLAYDILV